MDLERRIPCQRMNFIKELMPLSRHIESPISKKVLAVFDTALQKVLTVLCLQNIKESVEIQNEGSLLDRLSSYLDQTKEYDLIKASSLDNPHSHKSLSQKCEILKNTKPEINDSSKDNINEELENNIRNFLHFLSSQPLINQILSRILLDNNEQLMNEWKLPETITNYINKNENNLSKEMKTQEMLLEKLIETNRSEEETIRATIYKMESDIESKISKYDQEMTILQDEYDALEAEYTEEKSAYDELNERFQIINEEYQKIMEERRLEDERRQREEEQRRQMEQAVTTIQAFWRSYKTRKLARGRKGGGRKAKK
ncbi:repeat organellar protein, putative [Schistosoma mansoni]|nr:repeat organellar protein, putative [Schistosoma mansoni]|eukprot:XP_018646916.1 repeat organellar protein, putative [Schistosoma mansoni]